MRPVSRCLLLLLLGTSLFCAVSSNSHPRGSSSTLVLEATNTMRGIGGYKNTLLLVRLSDDGRLEWDKYVGNASQRHVGSLPIQRVSAIKTSLDAVDGSRMRGTKGPFHTYADTSNALRVRLATSHGVVAFTLINPWSCKVPSCLTRKPLSKDLKTVVCEIERLRAEVVRDEHMDQMCGNTDARQ
jgi:hypothetical protein